MKKLGPYDFEGTLGRGGMGTVFRGRHKDTGELHAVKVLSPVYSHDDHFRGRFESEIKALLQLDHPNIVKLISYGQDDGNLYFSMELVEGNSLFQMQKEGHDFNWRQVLSIAKDVCRGLRHAHDRGIIHRDLKPGNLLMTKFNSVKITDFGIAKSFGSNQNTGENILGTMDFMSPEQAKGERVTFRSDLYSLGSVLYTLLSGRPPFTANSIEESLRNLTRVPAPRIASKVPGVPEEFDKLIAKLMEKKPEKRIATALALFHRLEDMEEALKSYSEAKTAESGKPSTKTSGKSSSKSSGMKSDVDASTLDVDRNMATISHFTDHSTSGGSKSQPDPSPAFPTRADKTVVEEALEVQPAKIIPGRKQERPDFHNRVQERDRAAAITIEEDPIDAQYGKGWLPLLLMLVAVLLLTTYGLRNAYKTPSADQLYTEIQSEPPSDVLAQCKDFIESYPEDDRIETVERTYEFGKATKYYSQLNSRLKGRENLLGKESLTEIERQFMEIAELAKSSFEAALIRMDAFITVHDQNPDLSERDRKCVNAAKSFRLMIREEARIQAKTNLSSITNALERATSKEPLEAMKHYESIIELYDSMSKASNPEVREMVEEAKRRLEKLKSGDVAEPSKEDPSVDE